MTTHWDYNVAFVYLGSICFIVYPTIYSVMQSDGNSFWGDVVLDSFNIANRDEERILEYTWAVFVS